MNHSQQIKDILIKLAVADNLPQDLNELDASIFDPVFNGAVFPSELKDRYVSLTIPKDAVRIQVKLEDEGVIVDAFPHISGEACASTYKYYAEMEDGE